MAYDRIFRHYDSDFTLIGDLDSDLVESAEFELLRQGGCGSATLTLAEGFDTNTLAVNQHVQFLYTEGAAWYLGRVEEISKSLPSGTTVRLMGWITYLNDLALGGRGRGDAEDPIVYSDDDYFESDPDFGEQSRVNVSTVKAMVEDIVTNVIEPNTPIVLSAIDTPTGSNVLKSMVFRGEENVAQIIRSLAVSTGWMSWGCEENGLFFMENLPIASTHSYQIGVDVENLTETTDRSLMFNRIQLTGGYVYGNGTQHGFYPYKRGVVHFPSRATYGEKKVSLHLPWIRTNEDAQAFCAAFFTEYAGLTVRYTFDVAVDVSGATPTLPKPWLARVQLKDAAGAELKNAVPTSVHVQFNEDIVFSFTLGPEDLQFPSDKHPNRDEDFSPTDLGDGVPISCEGLVDPLAPALGWGETWDCESNAQVVFGVTTEEIVHPSTCIIGTPAVTSCIEIEYDDQSGQMVSTCRSFELYSFDPELDGTPAGVAVMARKVKNVYWPMWVGCESPTSGCGEETIAEDCEPSSSGA